MSTIPSARRIVEMSAHGYSLDDIERETGIPVAALRIIIRSPLVQGEIARLKHAA